MNINNVNKAIKSIGLFLLAKITAVLFLGGLSVIVYAFFRISTNVGLFALGAAITLVSLIIAKEGG